LGDFEDSTSNDQMVLIDTSVIAKDKTAGIVAKCAHDMAGGVQILRMAWLSDSIRKEQALDFTKYHISHGHQTTPAALDTAVKDHDQTMEGPLPSKTFESKFVCAQSSGVSAGAQENLLHNERLIAELTKLAKAYKSTNDKWRFFGYEKAIAAIRRHSRDIKDPREATKIPGLGQKMADKIGEIIESGKLRKTAEVCDNEKTRTMALFTRIWGGWGQQRQNHFTIKALDRSMISRLRQLSTDSKLLV
jgi:hypothetical protein